MDRCARSGRIRLLLFAVALGLAGCGLSEYESLMTDTQAREQRFLEEDKYLGPPVTIPPKEGKEPKSPLAQVFFRPPKGIAAQPQSTPRGDLLYRYDHQGSCEVAAVEMAFGSGEKDFGDQVLRALNLDSRDGGQSRQLQPPDRPVLLFNTVEGKDSQRSYSVNLYQQGQTQVAIIFWLWTPLTAEARKAMAFSLESLAVDADAIRAQMRYARKSPWRLTREALP